MFGHKTNRVPKETIDDYLEISNVLKIELWKEFMQQHKDVSEYDQLIEGQAANALLGEDIDAPIEAIKEPSLKEKVKASRSLISRRVHEILAIDKDYRKLIIYHLRRKVTIMRANFNDDKAFLISPQWLRTAQVIQPYDSEFTEEWSVEEYRRLLKKYFNSKGIKLSAP